MSVDSGRTEWFFDGGAPLTVRFRRMMAAAFLTMAWGLVLVIELRDFPNMGGFGFIVSTAELLFWLVAVVSTVYCARRVLRGRLSVVLAIVGLAMCVHFTNWAFYEPRSYFATHRWAFDQVAGLAESGELDTGEYLGPQLPRHLADLSTNGRIAVVGRQGDEPVYFMPQYMGLINNAVGYAYDNGDPDPELVIDLFGHPEYLASGVNLGDGWWYVKPGDSRR